MQTNSEHIFRLMTLKLSRQATPEENAYLEERIQSDPAVKALWEELCGTFNPKDVQEGFSRFDEKNWLPAENITRPSRIIQPWMWAAAAILIVVTGLCVFFSLRPVPPQPLAKNNIQPQGISLITANGQSLDLSDTANSRLVTGAKLHLSRNALQYESEETATGWNKLYVPAGMDYRVDLPDGSRIWLNSATTLHFPFTFNNNKREIKLEGEAYIEVSPDPKKPFFVKAGDATVQVLGTAFNVHAYNNSDVKVSLVKGSVRMEAVTGAILLKPGMQGSLHAQTLSEKEFDENETLAWREGRYYFNRASLREIAAVLARKYAINITMDREAIAGTTFSGVANFRKPLGVFLENMKSTSALQYYFDDAGTLHFN